MTWRLVYQVLLALALPVLPLRLLWRSRKEPLYRASMAERFGFFRTGSHAPLIWLHAVSLGEARAAQPLVRALSDRYPSHRLLITNMTATGRAASQALYPNATCVWLPYDYAWTMRRFVTHFRPSIGILMETEVWPNLVRECVHAAVPLLLANARLSERSARGYARVATLAREAFGGLSLTAAQSAADAARLRALGAGEVVVTGNLKFDVALPADLDARVAAMRACLGDRPVLLAASTRDGEEALILDALSRHPLYRTLLVIVPRHPQRFDAVAELVRDRGIRFARRSEDATVPADCALMIGDSLGELTTYYGASDVAFVGGSLLEFGAQNLIEACAAGAPVLIGPSIFNFTEAAAGAIAAGAARQVADANAMLLEAERLLGAPDERAAMSARGRSFCEDHAGATGRTLALCERLLARVATVRGAG